MKSYHFETLLSRTFFWFQYDFIQKNSTEKSPFTVKNAWKERMFTTMEKMDLKVETPVGIFNMQMHR